MIKYPIGIIILSLIFNSCNYTIIADFEITNNTAFSIDSLKIEPNINDVKKYISIKPGEKTEYKSDMTTIEKTDGAYQISFLVNGIKTTHDFGYYRNGYPLESITKIKIENDTILIDQIFDEN